MSGRNWSDTEFREYGYVAAEYERFAVWLHMRRNTDMRRWEMWNNYRGWWQPVPKRIPCLSVLSYEDTWAEPIREEEPRVSPTEADARGPENE